MGTGAGRTGTHGTGTARHGAARVGRGAVDGRGASDGRAEVGERAEVGGPGCVVGGRESRVRSGRAGWVRAEWGGRQGGRERRRAGRVRRVGGASAGAAPVRGAGASVPPAAGRPAPSCAPSCASAAEGASGAVRAAARLPRPPPGCPRSVRALRVPPGSVAVRAGGAVCRAVRPPYAHGPGPPPHALVYAAVVPEAPPAVAPGVGVPAQNMGDRPPCARRRALGASFP